jgi:hypothetical protein
MSFGYTCSGYTLVVLAHEFHGECAVPEQDISIWTSDEPFKAFLAKLRANLRNNGVFPTSDEADEAVLMLLVKAYIFGDKRLDVPFKNAVLVKLAQVLRAYKSTPSTKILEVIHDGTCPGSPLRRLVVDMIAHYAYNDEYWDKQVNQYSHEVAVEVLRAVVKGKRSPRMYWHWEALMDDYVEKVDD